MTLSLGSRSYLVQETDTGYMLTGTRGAKYQLVRRPKQPEYLFAVSLTASKGPVSNTPFHKCNVGFTDKDGTLRIFRR